MQGIVKRDDICVERKATVKKDSASSTLISYRVLRKMKASVLPSLKFETEFGTALSNNYSI